MPAPANEGIVRLPWTGGPCEKVEGPVLVSLTDARASSGEDLREIGELGAQLGRSWPVMQGAVGLWLWAKPHELRAGSLSVWTDRRDLMRFIRWPVHVDIMNGWRERMTITARSWEASRFDAEEIWARAEGLLRDAALP